MQLLGEQVGAEQALVDLLDAGELELLALGQLLCVLPQHEARALELLGEQRFTGLARFVPDLATDLIQHVGRGFDDVKRIETHERVLAALAHRR